MKGAVNPLLERIDKTSDRDANLHGLFLRALAWMLTLDKLNQGRDFQAIISGARALLEITVDLILLHYDKTNGSAWRMKWWGESAKLKAAKAVIEYYKNRIKKPVPPSNEDIVTFVQNQESIINEMRKVLWTDPKDPSKGRHPERWTDRRNLLQDVQEADRLHGSIIEAYFGSNLEEFYETEYRRMNWNVHGSGITGVHFLEAEGFNLMCALGFMWCARLSMICIDVVLRDLESDSRVSNICQFRKEEQKLFGLLLK